MERPLAKLYERLDERGDDDRRGRKENGYEGPNKESICFVFGEPRFEKRAHDGIYEDGTKIVDTFGKLTTVDVSREGRHGQRVLDYSNIKLGPSIYH